MSCFCYNASINDSENEDGETITQLQDTPLDQAPLVVLDTETTGLSPAMGHRVVEVAAVRLEGWREVNSFSALVNPGRPMDPGASRVNGIYDEDLVDAPPFSSVAPSLHRLLDGAVIVAHNARFDANFLGMEYSLFNAEAPTFEGPLEIDNAWMCTLQLARRLFTFNRNSLGHVAQSLGVRTGRAHRALNDVYTTIGILKRMTRQFHNWRLQTVGDVLHAQGGPIYASQQSQLQLPPALAEALSRRCSVLIRYQSRSSETERVISPLYASEQNGSTYVVAFCHLRQDKRTFRLDRIVRARLVD